LTIEGLGIVCECFLKDDCYKFNLQSNYFKGKLMKVCRCAYINYDEILENVKKYGNDIEAIQEETDAGTICEMCMFDECSKVEISLPKAIQKALKESGEN